MRKQKWMGIGRLLIIVVLLVLPIGFIALIVVYRDFVNGLPMYLRGALVFAVIGVSVGIFIMVPKLKLFSKLVGDAFNEWKDELKSYNQKNQKAVQGLTVDNTLYCGQTKQYTRLNIVKGFILIIITMSILIYGLMHDDMRSIVFLIVVGMVVYNYFIRRVIISPKGVRSIAGSKSQFIPWEKIKTIGVSSPWGKCRGDFVTVVYVSTKAFSDQTFIHEDRKGVITFKFKSRLIHHILCHYDGEIYNLHNVKRWRRYLERQHAKRTKSTIS